MHGVLSLTAALTLAATSLVAPLQQPVWLCKPGMASDICETTRLDATVVNLDGTTAAEPFERPQQRPVDCFYAYPTVNLLPESTPPTAEDEEKGVTLTQVGRLSARCRVFVRSTGRPRSPRTSSAASACRPTSRPGTRTSNKPSRTTGTTTTPTR